MDANSYEAPRLEFVGTLASLTQGSAVGNRLDASFSTTTPQSQLTFS